MSIFNRHNQQGRHSFDHNNSDIIQPETLPSSVESTTALEPTATVSTTLDSLTDKGWRVLHNTRWPGHPDQQIGHIAIGPSGVIVVEEPHTVVHYEAPDGVQEDLNCEVSQITALVAPRHRRTVTGMMVTSSSSNSELLTEAKTVALHDLGNQLAAMDSVITPVEVVLITAYLRDRLHPNDPRKTITHHTPEQ